MSNPSRSYQPRDRTTLDRQRERERERTYSPPSSSRRSSSPPSGYYHYVGQRSNISSFSSCDTYRPTYTDNCPPTRRRRSLSSPRRSRSSSPSRHRHGPVLKDRSSGSGYATSTSTLFQGLTFHLHVEKMSVDQVVADELRIVIRHHGGALSAIPDALHVTHIIVLTPHNAPKNMVKYIGDRSSSNFRPRGECIWLQNEIIRFLARLAGPGSNESHPSRKIVVREEWLDLCIEKRRVVDSSESYGGWEIRGTHDPNLAKDDNDGDSHSGTHHPSRPYTPSRPVTPALNNFQNPQQAVFEKPKDPRKKLIDRYQPIPAASTSELVASPLSQHVEESVATSGEGSLNPAGLHTNSATNLASSDMELKSESEVVKEERIDDGRPSSFDDAVGETSQRESAIIDQETERQESCRRSERFEDSPPREQSKTPVRDGDIEIDSVLNPEPKAKSNLRVQTHLVPERPPNITETSLHKERNPTGQKNDPSSSSCATFAPHPEKKVFARGIFPLSFCVHGTGTRKRSTEILISNNGGGILASCTYASIYVFPLSQGDSDIRDVGMLKILHHLRNQPGRMAVSEDWVLHCVDQDELLPLEGYLIFPERVYFMTPPASSQG